VALAKLNVGEIGGSWAKLFGRACALVGVELGRDEVVVLGNSPA
jgi:hypothetical protein